MSSTEEIADCRRAKEAAVEAGNMAEVVRLRAVEAGLLSKQIKEFKPNGRGS